MEGVEKMENTSLTRFVLKSNFFKQQSILYKIKRGKRKEYTINDGYSLYLNIKNLMFALS